MKIKDLSKNNIGRPTSIRDQLKAAYRAYEKTSHASHSRYAVAVSKSGNVYLKKAINEGDELDYTEVAAMLASKR